MNISSRNILSDKKDLDAAALFMLDNAGGCRGGAAAITLHTDRNPRDFVTAREAASRRYSSPLWPSRPFGPPGPLALPALGPPGSLPSCPTRGELLGTLA